MKWHYKVFIILNAVTIDLNGKKEGPIRAVALKYR